MPFNSDNADLKHYPGTSKEHAEKGYEVLQPNPKTGSNNERQLEGGKIPRQDPVGR
jgi:hypothetical protein